MPLESDLGVADTWIASGVAGRPSEAPVPAELTRTDLGQVLGQERT